MRLFSFIFGTKKVSVSEQNGAALLNICMKYRYSYYEMGSENGETYVVCSVSVAHRLQKKCLERKIEAKVGGLYGLPSVLLRFFSRAGLVTGLVCALLIIAASKNYVWDIRVTAPEGIDTGAVVDGLRECGFYRGSSLRDFSADAVENLFLRRSEDIGWISVNIKGTVAYVEVQKKITPPKSEKLSPANIVASFDGQITEMITYSGFRVAEVGENVREGQLLISGAYGEKTPGLHITRAAGKVLAKTFRTLNVEIPLEYEQKEETGRVFCEKFIIFFSNRIKVFSNYRNLGTTCDKIVEGKDFDFLGSPLPLCEQTETYIEYETVKKRYTPKEAESVALEELEKRVAALGAEQITDRRQSISFTEESCIITCELICIENIAKTVEFTADLD